MNETARHKSPHLIYFHMDDDMPQLGIFSFTLIFFVTGLEAAESAPMGCMFSHAKTCQSQQTALS